MTICWCANRAYTTCPATVAFHVSQSAWVWMSRHRGGEMWARLTVLRGPRGEGDVLVRGRELVEVAEEER